MRCRAVSRGVRDLFEKREQDIFSHEIECKASAGTGPVRRSCSMPWEMSEEIENPGKNAFNP